MEKANRMIALTLIVCAIFLYRMTFAWRSAPAMLPKLILITTIILSVLLFLRSRVTEKNKGEKNIFQGVSVSRVLLTIFATILYIQFSSILGFYFSTFIFLLVMFIFLGLKKKLLYLIIPALVILILFLIFTLWLKVPTPKGILF